MLSSRILIVDARVNDLVFDGALVVSVLILLFCNVDNIGKQYCIEVCCDWLNEIASKGEEKSFHSKAKNHFY